ncbi:MAG: carbohydate-binding domain-containing protein, partial [Bacteroidales bacterium]
MKIKRISVLMLVMLAATACKLQKPGPWPASDSILISWEVLSNTHAEQARVKAEFVIENQSHVVLSDSNWALYFNKSPRFIFDSGEQSGARVEHINGDWHRIVPMEGFELKPGEKFSLVYEARYWWIKETDAPKGLYFVFTDPDGAETIMEPTHFSVLPFVREEQLTRHARDKEPVPTPSFLYEQNRSLSVLAAN